VLKPRAPIYGMLAGLAWAGVHLASESFSGGVVSHHLLADPELPAISNWFGLFTLPLLGALVGARLRASANGARTAAGAIALGVVLAAGYGGAIALAFAAGADNVAELLFLTLFALAVLLPIYRIECLAGFTVGMTYVFGAVLPVLVGGVVAVASLALHPLLRRIVRLVSSARDRR
jgi:hypothetical protein